MILNKAITQRVFRRQIARYDEKQRTSDLWTSLNFIKKREVIAFCHERGFKLTFDEAITTIRLRG